MSMHQYPYYPGTGDLDEVGYGTGEGFNLNLPFASGTKEPDYLVSIIDIILPLLEKFEPELIMVSAGYDSHLDDRISSLGLLEESYYNIMLALSAFTRWSCDGRLGIVLEGGYNHISTSRSVVSTISACMDDYAEGRIKTVDDLKTLFGIDDNYRKKSVRNRDIINKIKNTLTWINNMKIRALLYSGLAILIIPLLLVVASSCRNYGGDFDIVYFFKTEPEKTVIDFLESLDNKDAVYIYNNLMISEDKVLLAGRNFWKSFQLSLKIFHR